MNKRLLNQKYKSPISYNKDLFIEEVNRVNESVNTKGLVALPTQVFSNGKRNAISYHLLLSITEGKPIPRLHFTT